MRNFLLLSLLLFAFRASPAQTVTFAHDVAPLVYRSCAPCHHAGGSGPFPLTSFEDVRRHATQIVDVTRRRYMPPWPPQPGIGDFQGDRHLSPAEIRLLATWVQSGQPAGDLAHAPTPPVFSTEWQLGPPDLVLHMPRPFELPAAGPDLFRNFVIPSPLRQTRYIRGFELRINAKQAVHHANVVLDRTASLRHRDGVDGQPGFPGMDVTTEAAPGDFEPDSHFLFWKPATVLTPEPPTRSWRLDAGTDPILNLHLQPTGKPETVSADIGLYFAAAPPTQFPMLLQLEHDGTIRIPPGVSNFTVTDHLTLPIDVDLLAIYPHAHYLGKVIEATAVLPNGTRLPLIRIPDWDIAWQATYDYRHPVFLPRATRVEMRVTYDNSKTNPRNPNHPPKLVLSGDRSQDEMGHVWLQVLPRNELAGDLGSNRKTDPRWALQEAVMRRRLQKYPGDFLAHYNLAAFLQSQGRFPEAVASYRKALAADPQSATAHNSLGSALLLSDHPSDALPEFETALRLNPGYANAHYNLARVLGSNGKTAEAEAEYRAVLRLQPDDVDSEAALGTLAYRRHDYTEALTRLRRATQLDPRNADAQANLGAVLAITGDLPAAVAAFEKALELNPTQPAARANLTRARAALAAHR